MRRISTIVAATLAAGAVIGHAPVALAKGGEDKPVVVLIDPRGNDVDVVNEVEVRNDVGTPLAVDTGASTRLPFALTAADDSADDDVIVSWTAPEDRFVIELVAASLRCPGSAACDGVTFAQLSVVTGSVEIAVPLVVSKYSAGGGFGSQRHVTHHSLRLYPDPGSVIEFFASSHPSDSVMRGTVVLSGYLIPVDEPSLAP